MPSEWAYAIAREQRRDVETMAANLDAAREQGCNDAATKLRTLPYPMDWKDQELGPTRRVWEEVLTRAAAELLKSGTCHEIDSD